MDDCLRAEEDGLDKEQESEEDETIPNLRIHRDVCVGLNPTSSGEQINACDGQWMDEWTAYLCWSAST